MTPEDRVERLRLSGAPINPSDIVEAIRAAENDALERVLALGRLTLALPMASAAQEFPSLVDAAPMIRALKSGPVE